MCEQKNKAELELDTFENSAMELIVSGGGAKAAYVNAIECARNGAFEKAVKYCQEAAELYEKAHDVHFAMIGRDDLVPSTQMEKLLLIHAEDQLNSAETFKILSEEFIRLYQRMNEMCEK